MKSFARLKPQRFGGQSGPNYVGSHAQRILDVGDLLAGVCMKSGVSPAPHPFDQFLRDHPFLEQQSQDVGLEQVPQDGGSKDGGVGETAVRPEGPRGSQDVQVGMPVEELPGSLDGDDGSGKRVASRIFTEDRGKSLPGAQGEFGENPSSMPECRPQDLGEREDEMPVGDGADHLLPDELGPQGGALGGTGTGT